MRALGIRCAFAGVPTPDLAGASTRHEAIVDKKMACAIQYTQGCALGENPPIGMHTKQHNGFWFNLVKFSS